MLSGIKIFNFFVSDHLKMSDEIKLLQNERNLNNMSWM